MYYTTRSEFKFLYPQSQYNTSSYICQGKERRKIKDFGKKVKIALIERGETQRELCAKVEIETGLKVDETYMSAILSGKKSPPRIVSAIAKILELDEEDEATESALQEIRLS